MAERRRLDPETSAYAFVSVRCRKAAKVGLTLDLAVFVEGCCRKDLVMEVPRLVVSFKNAKVAKSQAVAAQKGMVVNKTCPN